MIRGIRRAEAARSAEACAVDVAAFRPSVRQVLSVLLAAVLSLSLLGTNAFQALADETSDSTKKPLVYGEVYGLIAGEYAALTTTCAAPTGWARGIKDFAIVDADGEVLVSLDAAEVAGEDENARVTYVTSSFAKIHDALRYATNARPIEKVVEGGKEFGLVTSTGREVMFSQYDLVGGGVSTSLGLFGVDTEKATVDVYDRDYNSCGTLLIPTGSKSIQSVSYEESGIYNIGNGVVQFGVLYTDLSFAYYFWEVGTSPVLREGFWGYGGKTTYRTTSGETVRIEMTHEEWDRSNAEKDDVFHSRTYTCNTPLKSFNVEFDIAGNPKAGQHEYMWVDDQAIQMDLLAFGPVKWVGSEKATIKMYDLAGNAVSGFDDVVAMAALSKNACLCKDIDGAYSVRNAKGEVLDALSDYEGYSFYSLDGKIFGENTTEKKCVLLSYGATGCTPITAIDMTSLAPEGYRISSCTLKKSDITGGYGIMASSDKIPDPVPEPPSSSSTESGVATDLVQTGTNIATDLVQAARPLTETVVLAPPKNTSGEVVVLFDEAWSPVSGKTQAQMNALMRATKYYPVLDGRNAYGIPFSDAVALGFVPTPSNPDGILVPTGFDSWASYVDEKLARITVDGREIYKHYYERLDNAVRVPSYVNAKNHRITMVKDSSNKVGAVNATGKLVVPCEYEECCALEGMPFALLKKDGAWFTSESLIQASKTVHSSGDSAVKGHATVNSEDEVLPEELQDATLSIKDVASSFLDKVKQLLSSVIGTKGSVPHAFEVNFVDSENNVIPWNDEDRPLTVSFALTDAMKSAMATCELKVFHIDALGVNKTEMDTTVGTDTISFETTHFSTYAVVAVPRTTGSEGGNPPGDDPTPDPTPNPNPNPTPTPDPSPDPSPDPTPDGDDDTKYAYYTYTPNGSNGGTTSGAGASTGSKSSLVKTGDATAVLVLGIFLVLGGSAFALMRLRGREKRRED